MRLHINIFKRQRDIIHIYIYMACIGDSYPIGSAKDDHII